MPYFSFSLKQNFLKNTNLRLENIDKIENNKIYYSKNTLLWKKLTTFKKKELINFVKFEKRKKINKIGKKILFCLPPSIGLGDAVEYALAIKTIYDSNRFEFVGVAFVGRFVHIFKKYFALHHVYPDFIEKRNLYNYDNIFHFSLEINEFKFQKYKRLDIEKTILNFFNIKIDRKEKFINSNKIKKISIFPISQSPIRTMPTNIINEIINKLEDNFAIEIIFDKNSQISNYVESKILSKKIKKTHPQNIIELSALIEKIEFGIFIDSGPLHLAKILAKKGLLITTSIDSNHLLNKFETIKVFNTYYKSSYCTSPCGLTNLINYKKKIGCYDSLKINFNNISNLDNYNSLQRGNLKDKYINFVINPVGCIKKIDINALLKSIMKNTL